MNDPRLQPLSPLAALSWRKRMLYRLGMFVYGLTCARERHWFMRVMIGPEVHGRAGVVLPGYRCRLCGHYEIRAKELVR